MTERPGSAADEAARLAAVLQQWVRQLAGAGLAGMGAHVGAHIATGSAECRLCPFCQLLSLAKHTSPEVFLHLSDASTSLLAAMRAALDARDRSWASRARGGLEHIDIS